MRSLRPLGAVFGVTLLHQDHLTGGREGCSRRTEAVVHMHLLSSVLGGGQPRQESCDVTCSLQSSPRRPGVIEFDVEVNELIRHQVCHKMQMSG